MTTSKVSSPVRRFSLPVVCAVLAATSAVGGETILREYANQPEIGPLLADQVAVMGTVAFACLFLITTLIAIFPGRDLAAEPETDQGLDLGMDMDQEQAEALDEANDPAASNVVSALKRSATKHAQERDDATRAAEAAERRATELEEVVAGFREGTSAEAQAMRAKIRDEANREALAKVAEVSEASERLSAALRDARARAEAQLVEAKETAAASLAAEQERAEALLREAKEKAAEALAAATAQAAADLSAERARAADELAVHRAESAAQLAAMRQQIQAAEDATAAAIQEMNERIPRERHEAAVEAHRRIALTAQAINSTEVDVLDHLQRAAVLAHVERIRDALARLDPDAASAFGPSLPVPPLDTAAATDSAPTSDQAAGEGTAKRRGRFRRGRN